MTTAMFDRRGFDTFLRCNLALLPISLLFFFIIHWQYAFVLFILSCLSFVTVESIARRPDNNPHTFLRFIQSKGGSRVAPVLLCLGDSLTHGNLSGSFTPYIPYRLTQELGLEIADCAKTFSEPLFVVNGAQNNITSGVLLERLNLYLNTYPDYVLIMIGTNDVQCLYGGIASYYLRRINHVIDAPRTLDTFQSNLTAILRYICTASPQVQIGVCTLPPLGERLTVPPNSTLIQQANDRIRNVVADMKDKVTLIDVYGEFESVLEKKKRRLWTWPFAWRFLPMLIIHPIYQVFFANWNLLSSLFGYALLNDGLHLNDRGRDIVVNLVVEWLIAKQVAKAIAVKR